MTEERRLANRKRSLRFPCGLDSQVVLGALVKGRAASPKLNQLMRRNMGYPVGADLYSLPMYHNTASNRADGPTRGCPPALPDLPVPTWWTSLEQGDYDSFDRWITAVGAPHGEFSLPFGDWCGRQDLSLKLARKEKSDRWHARGVGRRLAQQTLGQKSGSPAELSTAEESQPTLSKTGV